MLDETYSVQNSVDWRFYSNQNDKRALLSRRSNYSTNLRDYEAITSRISNTLHTYLVSAEAMVLAASVKREPNGDESIVGQIADTVDKRKVFVAYGQDERLRLAVFALLRAANLEPMEWNQIIQMTIQATGQGSPYIGDVLNTGMSIAQAVVVLFTGDERATLREGLVKPGQQPEPPVLQPRPNVILEAGMALARYPERTVLVEVGKVRQMSDLLGRHVVRLDNSPQRRKELLDRMATAGCAVNLQGADWMTIGDLSG